jgi:hypothetical protein
MGFDGHHHEQVSIRSTATRFAPSLQPDALFVVDSGRNPNPDLAGAPFSA